MFKSGVAAVGLMLLLTSYAHAGSFLDGDEVGQSGNYVGVSSGLLFAKSTFTDRNGASGDLNFDDIGIPVSVYLGHQFGIGLRVEGELLYKTVTANTFNYSGVSNKISSQVWALGAMGNLYYDFYHDLRRLADSPILPYVGFGAGFAYVNISDGTVDGFKLWNTGYDTVFAYQAIVGSSLPINKKFLMDVSYRYFAVTNVHIDKVKTDYNNHNILLGVRYLFR